MSLPGDALTIARGDVRDGVAAIEGFLQVLASRRVGPRVIASALPAVASGCAPLRAALTSLGGALEDELSADPEGIAAVHALLGRASDRVRELEEALASRGKPTLEARERLALEAQVRQVAGELTAVVRLTDLLAGPVTSETMTIDFRDALGQRSHNTRPDATPVLAEVDLGATELRVGDARIVLELLDFAVATVARAGVRAPCVAVQNGPEGFPVLTVDGRKARQRPGVPPLVLDVGVREALPGELSVVKAAANHAGIRFTVSADERLVTIAL